MTALPHRAADEPAAGPVLVRPPLVRSRGMPRQWLIWVARCLGRVLMPTYFRLQVLGRANVPRNGAVLLAGNHTSFLDGPLVFSVAPRTAQFYIKEEMYAGSVARALDWLGQIPINRGRPDRRALRRGLAALGAGEAVGMFPEGSRGAGDLGSVQHGIAFLALKAGCPVVPVACLGSAAALPPGKGRPRWRAPVAVVFGAPFRLAVSADPQTRRAVADAAEQIRVRLADHVAHAAKDLGWSASAPPTGG
ncbi:MAG: lysophospholipid acyltransferase family protein [Actinomycetes bacterium]